MIAARSCRSSWRAVPYASLGLLDDDGPRRFGHRRRRPRASAHRSRRTPCPTRTAPCGNRWRTRSSAAARVWSTSGNVALLIRIAVRNQPVVLADDQARSRSSPTWIVSTIDQSASSEISPTIQPISCCALRQADRDRRGREKVVVGLDGRDERLVRPLPRLLGDRPSDWCRWRWSRAARPASIEDGDLAKFAELQHVVFEGPVLLPRRQPRRRQLRADRLKHSRVVLACTC